ncbi:MAG: DNA/RNA nuclease SfsA [Lachnospiraceae bacterium]|nr:DNA/RNA nuclease SfsA [Lachnospiraceae bacterium]
MKYEHVIQGKFAVRQNRFIAQVWIGGRLETVHVKNTGRCKELLLPGAEVILAVSDNPKRKTKYDLIGVYKEKLGWVNIDSLAPNKVVGEWLAQQDYSYIKPEYMYGESRIDFYMEQDGKKYLMEVKGCTLELGGRGFFPDAPSERARRHVKELVKAVHNGYHSIIAFVIPMEGVTEVLPNLTVDPGFGEALREAEKAGVAIWYFPCFVTEKTLDIRERLIRGNVLPETENDS